MTTSFLINARTFVGAVSAIVFGLLVVSGAADARERATQLTAQSPYASEIYAFLMEQEVLQHETCATLLVGSSSIRFWFNANDDFPDHRIVRRGFGGSELSDVIYYFDLIVAPLKPSAIVLYEGENDLSRGKTPTTFVEDMEAFMALKSEALGETPVYFISIKPSHDRIEDFSKQTQANEMISQMADNRADLTYVDVVSGMLVDGKPKDIFVSDGLHMTLEGYAIWREALTKAFERPLDARSPYCREQ